MKKFLVLAISLFAVISLFSEISLNFTNNSTYTDNVFQLSDDDLDAHDAGIAFDYIETSDDLINSSRLTVSSRNKIGKIRYDFFVRGSYDAYLKNTDKSKAAVSTGFGIDSRRFNTSFVYGYYPDNYVRNYRDKDGTDEYEKFEYDKNLYKVDAEYRFTRKAYLLAYFKFEQYYHNEYFTEYDGDAITPGLGLKYSFSELYLEGWYYYRSYETHDDIIPDDDISDQSYESNTYSVQLRMKKIKTKKFAYRPVFNFKYEKRYYDGWDKYHNGREDDTITINPWVKFYLTDYLNITLDYTSKIRNVSSESQSVEDSKSYQENQMSISFELPIKL
jgi:hypothetical protein